MYQFLTLLVALLAANAHAYKVGVGSADMTGPAAQVNFMVSNVTSNKLSEAHRSEF